jgi:hypothetical protein
MAANLREPLEVGIQDSGSTDSLPASDFADRGTWTDHRGPPYLGLVVERGCPDRNTCGSAIDRGRPIPQESAGPGR